MDQREDKAARAWTQGWCVTQCVKLQPDSSY